MKTSKQLLNGEVLDLKDEIALVSPTDTPLISLIMAAGKTVPATSTKVEWREEALNDQRINPSVEGSEKGTTITSDRKSYSNNCQILKRDTGISGTLKSLNVKGVGDELERQIDHRLKEIKRDMEYYSIQGAKADESGSVGRQMNGVLNLIASDNTIDVVDETKFTKDSIESAFVKLWDRGASDGRIIALCNSVVKKKINTLLEKSGQLTVNQGTDNVLGVVCQKIVTDYGEADIVLDRHMPSDTLLLLNLDYTELGELRTAQAKDLGVTGDKEEVMVVWEGAVKLLNQYAGAKIINIKAAAKQVAKNEDPEADQEVDQEK